MVSSVCTKTLTINQSGVARFLVETEGTGILNEMRAKFQICISLDKIHWAPLQSQVMLNVTQFCVCVSSYFVYVYFRFEAGL